MSCFQKRLQSPLPSQLRAYFTNILPLQTVQFFLTRKMTDVNAPAIKLIVCAIYCTHIFDLVFWKIHCVLFYFALGELIVPLVCAMTNNFIFFSKHRRKVNPHLSQILDLVGSSFSLYERLIEHLVSRFRESNFDPVYAVLRCDVAMLLHERKEKVQHCTKVLYAASSFYSDVWTLAPVVSFVRTFLILNATQLSCRPWLRATVILYLVDKVKWSGCRSTEMLRVLTKYVTHYRERVSLEVQKLLQFSFDTTITKRM